MAFDEAVLAGLRVLAAVVEAGSFVRAGEALDMSQSGVSRAIARLEARLQVRLFERTTRRVSLTDEGRRFYGQAAPLLAGLEEAIDGARAGSAQVSGRLRVNLDPFFSRVMLGPRLGEFLRAYPQVELDLVTREQFGDMVGDGFDLALRFGHPSSSTLVARRLLQTRVLTVAAPAYLKRHGVPREPADLAHGRHNCIRFRDPVGGRPFDWEFHRGAQKVVIAAESPLTLNDAGTLESVLLAGLGMAQVFELAVAPLLAAGKLVAVLPEWQDERFPLFALYPSRQYMPARTRAFLDFVETLAR